MRRWILLIITNLLVMLTLVLIANIVMAYFQIPFNSYTGLMIFCFILGMGGSFISLMLSKKMAKWIMQIQPADPHGELAQKVHLLAKRAGLNKTPEVYYYNSPEINAFATGPSRNNSLVAVSTGLLNDMSADEAEAVLAHEVSHIANGDMVTMTLVQGVVNAFVMFFSYIVSNIVMNALRGDDDEGGGLGDFFLYYIIHSLVYTLLSFLSLPLVMGVSRWREYRADLGSARLVGKEKMIAALNALKRTQDGLTKHDKGIDVMAISGKPSGFLEWFSSHPPLDKRIDHLRKTRI